MATETSHPHQEAGMKRLFGARSQFAQILGMATLTIAGLHIAVGSAAGDEALQRANCFHYICDEAGTCTVHAINHTCCFVENPDGPPTCQSDSCILGETCLS
jgi:hypothetical protein